MRRQGWKILNSKWCFGTAICPTMKLITTGKGIRRSVGKSLVPTAGKERNLLDQINAARRTTIHPRTMTPEPSSGCPCALEKIWWWNFYGLYSESNQWMVTEHLDNNTMHTMNCASRIVMAHSPEGICRCGGRMGFSPQARRGLILSSGLPESWKVKAESLGVSRLLEGDWWSNVWKCHISPVPWWVKAWSQTNK